MNITKLTLPINLDDVLLECMKKVIEFMAKWDGKIVKEVCP